MCKKTRRIPSGRSGATRETVLAWERLARRVIKFVNKSRRVREAFNGYKWFSLRNTEGSRPTQARGLHEGSRPHQGAPSLYEGPALSNGPNRRRAQAIKNLGEARAWLGVDGTLSDAILAACALGQPARVREVALIPGRLGTVLLVASRCKKQESRGTSQARKLKLIERGPYARCGDKHV